MKLVHSIICISTISFQIFSSPTFADCKSSKKNAKQQVELISTQMRGANICKSNELTVRALKINIEYLDACPTVDPDGYKREEVLISIKNAEKAKKATCS